MLNIYVRILHPTVPCNACYVQDHENIGNCRPDYSVKYCIVYYVKYCIYSNGLVMFGILKRIK